MIAALLLAATAHAGVVNSWSIAELAQAPVLAVCLVENVAKREPVAPGAVRWPGTHQWHEATLLVQRVHSNLEQAPRPGDRITLRYIGFGDPVNGTTGSPIWPIFQKGKRAVFPLSPSKDQPAQWSLFAQEGTNTTVPAIEKEWRSQTTPREFILTELINALANGSPAEQSAASSYLREPFNFPTEAQPLLDAAIGDDEERWLAVASAIVSSLATPHPSVTQILSGTVDDQLVRRPKLGLLAHALQKSGRSGFPDRLIIKLVDDAPTHASGSATTLLEWKDSEVLLARLRDALSRNQPGAVTIAWTLVRSEQRSILPHALPAALHLVLNPGPVIMSELQAASGLIRDHGDDGQFNALVATLRQLQTTNVEDYRKLFSAASYSENKREIALAAVLIDDPREGFPPMRYCDVAAGRLQHLSGRDFGVTPNMTRPDWDRAVSHARQWLKTR